MKEDKAKKAEEAIDREAKVSYMTGTEGWNLVEKEIKKELDWAFNNSISPAFREEVKEKSEVYFEHYGYVNGLKQIEVIISKIRRAAETARKDKEKWELRKNPRS